jgi:hypothetical protein
VVRLHEVEPSLEPLQEPLIDHRPIQHVLRRVADDGRLHGICEGVDERVVHRAVHPHRAERRAPLPCRPESTEERPLDGEVEVGVRHDDHRVLAAELQAR